MPVDLSTLIAESEREERLTLAFLEQWNVEHVRLSLIAKVAGISKGKVRNDVDRGYLRVDQWMRCGTRKMALVAKDEAVRYLRELKAA